MQNLRLPEALVLEMHQMHMGGEPLSVVARKYGKHKSSVVACFARRGLTVRPVSDIMMRRAQESPGCFQPKPLVSQARVDEIIATIPRLKIPDELRLDWRKWDMARRMDFINRIRTRLNDPRVAPKGPCSEGMVPFDYGTPRAWEIMNKMNEGLISKTFAIKININTQGIIFRDKLWFWCHKVGYWNGKWNPETGRPILHHVIWTEHHRKPVPPQHALRFIDGNRNNHAIENLQLIHRAELCFENLNGTRHRRGREKLRTILSMNTTTPTTSHESINSILGR